SGAFAVGMLNILDEIECLLYEKFLQQETPSNPFERKKRIIFQSLYGVEIKQWAVWITQLRLWITLLIEAEDNLKNSEEPLLPSFDFKIRQGDSLIQILGDYLFPVSGEGLISPQIQNNINELIKLKNDYFYNKYPNKQQEIEHKQRELYIQILEKKRRELLSSLNRLKRESVKEVQTNIFNSDYKMELVVTTNKKKCEEEILKYQIDTLENEINQINNNNLPFVWKIDFPEVFIRKEGFDIVIGNPPYVPQEEIEDPLGKIDRNTYKGLLRTMAAQDFPQDLKESIINGKSDLYTFFYIRGLRLLNSKGILTYISSNSWLDVEFGAWLQKFLLENCPVYFIFDNLSKRVFRTADINTIIAVIGAKQKMVASDDLIRFAAFKLPFESSLYTENFLTIEETQNRIDYDDLRVNPVPRIKLLEEGLNNSTDNKYIGNMWGSYYIRSPHFFLNILEKCENKLVNLNKIAVIKGYIHDNSVSDKYPTKYFVKSVKDINVLGVDTNTPGVIRKGIKPSHGNDIIAPILYPRTFGSRHIVIRNLDKIYFKEFYKIIPIEEKSIDSIFIQLNSSFGVFQREILGLSNLGGGALKFSINSIGLFRLFTKIEYKDYCDILEPLLTEKVDDFFVECNKSYRIELDDIIFNYLGLTKDERRTFMVTLKDMIENRLNRASVC
ncbi:MAG TPA: Eco57I restriction-modification methylase domain-containing protein, partial [Candidatus Pacearchaeota archaeon]|nr:Eco57I restriction-modification methylase domain-containing protein [Candidatus Pacearchaeota archaeon]